MPPREQPRGQFWEPSQARPTTPAQALMEAAPGEGVAASTIEDQHPLAEVLDELLADMDETDRDIVTMHVAGISVRDIAQMVGSSKTQVHRRLPILMREVAKRLRKSEEVKCYLQALQGLPPSDQNSE